MQIAEAEALGLARTLRWLPLEYESFANELAALPDYQRGWYISLYLACCRAPIPGYLRCGAEGASSLWNVVGARRSQSFTERSAAVLAAFRFAEIDGEKYLYHPQLLRVLAQQIGKLHKKRGKSEGSTGPPHLAVGAQLPLHLFSVLEGKKKPERKSVCAEGVNDGRNSTEAERLAERYREICASRNRAK